MKGNQIQILANFYQEIWICQLQPNSSSQKKKKKKKKKQTNKQTNNRA